MKKIIIFGASGDIGRYFVEYFCDNYSGNDYEIIASGSKDINVFDNFNVQYIKVDITKTDDFEKLPQDVYAVIDLAGMMPARMKGYTPQKYIDVNISGTLNILEYCRKTNADRILFSQSFGDIKDHSEVNPILYPNMARNFKFTTDHTIYVLSKNMAVDMIENYHQMYGLKRFIFRLPTIHLWSPIQTFYVDGVERPIGYMSLINKAVKGEPIEIWGDKTRPKDMIYVKDFCQMLYKALFVNREAGYYNVGTGIGTTLEDQIKGMVDVFGSENCRSQISERPDLPNAPQYIMDITAAIDELDYHPRFGYLDMLKDYKNEMNRTDNPKW